MPSGTLWATCNVGARKPTDYGLYFQWGDTIGYEAEQVGKDKQFASDYSDYKWRLSGDSWQNIAFTKYATTGATLELEDDAAHAIMGGSWHIPTPTQFQELLNTAYTKNEWTTQGGVNGRLFTSKNDPSKSVFIPAAGSAYDGSVPDSGDVGNVWSSMLSMNSADGGQYLNFYSGNAGLGNDGRYDGFSVRGVIG